VGLDRRRWRSVESCKLVVASLFLGSRVERPGGV